MTTFLAIIGFIALVVLFAAIVEQTIDHFCIEFYNTESEINFYMIIIIIFAILLGTAWYYF